MKGRVKWWCQEQGYGFIEYDENKNAFVYLKNNEPKEKNLKDNQKIEFTIEEKDNFSYINIQKVLEN